MGDLLGFALKCTLDCVLLHGDIWRLVSLLGSFAAIVLICEVDQGDRRDIGFRVG